MILKKWWQFLLLFIVVSVLSVAALVALTVITVYPTLPTLETLTNYRPKLPLRVYSVEGSLMAEFGEERRAFMRIEDIPKDLKDAVLAIEDRRFYQHGGIDTKGVIRAIRNNVTMGTHEGASTITMQVAKNFFTVPGKKRSLITKIKEALLALKIEKTLTKDQIFELYLNQIYLGQRSYGFAAASQVYYGKPLSKLNLAECALLAGLPKAPSSYNPYVHLDRAVKRQHEVLRDMQRFSFINESEYKQAAAQTLKFKKSKQARDLQADYVAEIVRQMLYEQYQEEIYSSGLKVYTTIKKANQEAANQAVLMGILEYQRRQGYQGPEKNIDLTQFNANDMTQDLQAALDEIDSYAGLVPAVVTEVSPKAVKVYAKNGELLTIKDKGLALLQKNLADKKIENRKIKPGSIVRIVKEGEEFTIVQLPQVEAALIGLDPDTGAVNALAGGFDYNKNKFNHVTQAWRQPGSSFKPFVYSAALEKGYTPASIILDGPISISAAENGSNKVWEPKNFDEKYSGPTRMRTALTKSKNMVSIRILQRIGARYAQDYVTKFGFSRKDHPAYLTMALGAGAATPWGMANGYAVFANGGYRVTPHLISKITDSEGKLIEEMHYPKANEDAPLVIDPRNAFLMTSMMHDVVQVGTATKAKTLGRQDLAGKTGTTNNNQDAWFAGYTPKQVAIAWIGYDQPRSLGKDETGGKAALPIWIRFMSTALKGMPDNPYKAPEGVMQVKIDPATGGMINEDDVGIYEYFYEEHPPRTQEVELPPLEEPGSSDLPPDIANDNPLQPAPPDAGAPNSAPPAPAGAEPNEAPSNPGARILNPSGY